MITASDARKLAMDSDFGMKPFMEEIHRIIDIAANDGEMQVEIIFPNNVRQALIDAGMRYLLSIGYSVKMIEVADRFFDEEAGEYENVLETGYLVSWGLVH